MSKNRQAIAHDIAAAAADWIVRLDGDQMTQADEDAFARWCEEAAHRDALTRLKRVWGLLDTDEGTVADLTPSRPSRRRLWPRRAPGVRPAHRSAWRAGAVAAALALVMVGVLQDWPMRLRADHMTGIGERRTIELADGSVVRLDSGSAVALDYSGSRRIVRLLAGAALFQVAADRARPFTVEAGGGSVTALGTAFMVRDEGDKATVTVTQHSVRVQGDSRATVVAEGQRVDFGDTTLTGPRAADGQATAWTRGRLIVVNRPLGEVVAQIGRYRHGYITVTGPAAAIRVSGAYHVDHPLAAIDSIERSLGLSSVRLSNRFIILSR